MSKVLGMIYEAKKAKESLSQDTMKANKKGLKPSP